MGVHQAQQYVEAGGDPRQFAYEPEPIDQESDG